MRTALDEASLAAVAGDVPVGAVIAIDGRIIARAHNSMRASGNPTLHAELLAIDSAIQYLQSKAALSVVRSPGDSATDTDAVATQAAEQRLEQCTLVVTLEPCAMCAGAIVLARVGRLVFGAWDDKAGMCGSIGDVVRHPKLNHRPEVSAGVLHEESARLLKEFFAVRRGASPHHVPR